MQTNFDYIYRHAVVAVVAIGWRKMQSSLGLGGVLRFHK